MTSMPMELHATWAFAFIYLPQESLLAALLVYGIGDSLDCLLCFIPTRIQEFNICSKVTTIKNEAHNTKVLLYAFDTVAKGME